MRIEQMGALLFIGSNWVSLRLLKTARCSALNFKTHIALWVFQPSLLSQSVRERNLNVWLELFIEEAELSFLSGSRPLINCSDHIACLLRKICSPTQWQNCNIDNA